MTAVWHLRFRLLGWWHAGSGRGTGGAYDAAFLRSPDGLPWLPGRTCRGLLRDAVDTAAELGHVPAELPVWAFGSPPPRLPEDRPGRGRHLRRARFETDPGALRIGSAELSPDWRAWARAARPEELDAFYEPLARTAIRDGVARAHTLRTMEVAGPMELRAPVTLAGAAPPLPDWPDRIREALPFLRALGTGRHRGLGRVKVELCEGEAWP
jgi:hypothetical protein